MRFSVALPARARVQRAFSGVSMAAGDATAAFFTTSATAGALAAVATSKPVAASCSFLVASVAGYCWRRGKLHRWPDARPLGAAEVLRRHLAYEAEWHDKGGSEALGRMLHAAHVVAWLLVFQPLYPALEAVLYPCDLAAFYFYYPKARGAGLVIESRQLRRDGARGSASQLLRVDWHRFELNIGKQYPPPNTGRHPPSVRCNLPHVDLPQRRPAIRHWPWRQHTGTLLWALPHAAPASGA